MATPRDTTTVLNPGAAGDSMDESAIVAVDGATIGKRPRVVVGGELERDSIVEPEYSRGRRAMPTADASVHDKLDRMAELLTEIRDLLQEIA